MAVISLPLTFKNSFWSQDYRTGLEVIFKKLEQGVAENEEIVAFVRARAVAEAQFAVSLKNEPPSKAGVGFEADDGASLLVAFRGLQAETAEHGLLHEAVSVELHTLVAEPFEGWTGKFKERLDGAKEQALQVWITRFEENCVHVEQVKQDYIDKSRIADEAEDDARFVSNDVGDRYTSPLSSPRSATHNIRKTPKRQPTLSERVTQRLLGLGRSAAAANAAPPAPPLPVFDAEAEKSPNLEPRLDKGKAKATEVDLTQSPPSLSPPLPPRLTVTTESGTEEDVDNKKVLLAGLPFTYPQISAFLTRAKAEMSLTAVKFPLIGEYQECFSGEQFVAWLRAGVPEFQEDLDIVVQAAKDLTEREDLLRKVGEFGNQFDNADDVFYQFRPKAFTLGQALSVQTGSASPGTASPLQRLAPELVKTSNTFMDIVTKAWGANAEPPFIRHRREATTAESQYRKAIRDLDRHRLELEERIEDLLKALQTWESDRLHAVKSALLQYQGSISNLRKSYEASSDRSSTLISAYNPDSDLKTLIEAYRTGPFRPKAHVFESIAHEQGENVFGIDLRKWVEGGWGSDEVRRDSLPPVLTLLLDTLNDAYGDVPADAEKRKSWIYEVPLTAVHHLREKVNALPEGKEVPEDALENYDAPIVAAAVKLWLLELEPPLGLYDAWDEIRKIYPSVGAMTREQSEDERLEAVAAALLKFPKIHLLVLDAILKHLKFLIDNTKTDEPNELFVSKLALAFGRSILRPRVENELTLQDRHPTLLFIDLVQQYDRLLPPTLAKKKRESDRKVPQRKRTAMVDMRLRRSNIGDTADLKEAVIQQNTRRTGPGSRSSISTTTGPPDSVRVPTAGQDTKANVPSILRVGSGASNTSPVPSPPQIASPSPSPAFVAPPPPPPLEQQTELATPPPPPGFVPPPPPPPLAATPQEDASFPEPGPRPSFSDSVSPPDGYVPPPMPAFRDPSDVPSPHSPNPTSDPPSRSSSPAVGGGNRPGQPQRTTSGIRGPRTGGARGPRTSVPPAPGRRESYSQQFRPQTPPSPNTNALRGTGRATSTGPYNPSAHRRSGSGSGNSFVRRTMDSDAEDTIL